MKPVKEGFTGKAPSFDGYSPFFQSTPGLNAQPVDYFLLKNRP